MRPILVATIATMILLAGCASTPFDAVEAPTLKSGYAYTYDVAGAVTGSASFSAPGEEPESETIDESFGPMKAFSYEIISTQGPEDTYLAAFLIHDSLGGLLDLPTLGAIRKADLTFLETGTSANAIVVKQSPAVDLAFPLTAGKTWSYVLPSVPASLEGDVAGIGDLVYTAEATQATNVQVGNESVTAIEVVHRISAPGFNEAMKEAQEQFEAQGLDGSITGSFSGRRIIHYAPALEAIVRDTIIVDVAINMRLTYEGETMTAKANTHTDVSFTLAGMDRMPEADRTVSQALDFVNKGQAIEAPGVVELPGEAFSLAINQTATEVNAADAPTVTFTAVGEIPEGANLTWRVFDAAGTQAATGAGETLAFKVDKPGAYGIQLVGRDANDRLAASSSTLLIADFDGTVALSCGPVSVTVPVGNTGQNCAPANLEVPPGMLGFSLALDAGATGPAPGTFRVSDGATTVNTQTQNGMATVDDGDLSPGTWSMQWRPTVGIAHSPSVHVTLDYGSAPKAPDAMESAISALRALDLPFELPF